MNTLQLAPDTWDLVVNAQGNIAMLSGVDAISQDIASAIKTFQGEVWYNTTLGVPWLPKVIGFVLATSYVQAQIEAQALTVDGVATAKCTLSSFVAGIAHGMVSFTTEDSTGTVNF